MNEQDLLIKNLREKIASLHLRHTHLECVTKEEITQLKFSVVAKEQINSYLRAELNERDKKLKQYCEQNIDLKDEIEELQKEETKEVHYNRGNAKAEVNDFVGAIEDYTMALKKDSRFVWAWINRGNATAQLKNYDAAYTDYTNAIRLKPDCAEAWFNRGRAQAELKHYDEALSDFANAKELNPQKYKEKCNLQYEWYAEYMLSYIESLKKENAHLKPQVERLQQIRKCCLESYPVDGGR